MSVNISNGYTVILRSHPHTPGRYPGPFNNSFWRSFLLCAGLGKSGVSSQIILYHIVSYYMILYHSILYHIISYYIIVYYCALYYVVLYYVVLYHNILCYIILYYIVIYNIKSYCIILYCIISYQIILFVRICMHRFDAHAPAAMLLSFPLNPRLRSLAFVVHGSLTSDVPKTSSRSETLGMSGMNFVSQKYQKHRNWWKQVANWMLINFTFETVEIFRIFP